MMSCSLSNSHPCVVGLVADFYLCVFRSGDGQVNSFDIPNFDPKYNMPITRDVAQALAEHYKFICQLSGRTVAGGSFHVDHIFPRALGGADNLQNYVIADASANIGKNARRLDLSIEHRLLSQAAEAAPTILATLLDQRGKDGKPINPIALLALRRQGLTLGTRVATGAYLRSAETLADGVRWWAYWGPDRTAGVLHDILQFGLKLTGRGVCFAPALRAASTIRERGGDTFYIPIPATLPGNIDLVALRNARSRLERIITASSAP
jgi:hypothetical protein